MVREMCDLVFDCVSTFLRSSFSFSPPSTQGWNPNFLSPVLNPKVPHALVPVTDDDALQTSRALAREEGIFCGISSGGTFAAGERRRTRALPRRICATPQ
jgi:cysteine synthase